jgi:hypothetical protein
MKLEELELIVLEHALDDDASCEVKHTQTVCSIEVTHRVTWCKGAKLVCASSVYDPVAGTLAKMERTSSVCRDCERPPRLCWQVVPV